MAEYIDRDGLLEEIEAAEKHGGMGSVVAGTLRRYVKRMPAADIVPVVHAKKVKTKKHKWIRDEDGKIDFSAFYENYCNGPLCIACGKSFCEHCVSRFGGEEAIKQNLEAETCYEREVCSICGRDVPEDAPYCNCGAKLDG